MKQQGLKMKDIATIGIFGAILYVVTMIVGAVTGMEMTIYMFSCSFVALFSAPFYMLIMAKVHKKGAVLMTCAIVGILWALFGGIFVLLWMIILGIAGEIIASKTKYQNYKALTASFVLYVTAYYLGALAPLYYYSSYYYSHGYSEEATEGLINAAHTTAAYVSVPVMLVVSVLAAFIAKKMLHKHFEKAGVI